MGWKAKRFGDRVVAVFDGRLTSEEGRASVAEFVAKLGDSVEVDIVFDIRRMEGYEPGARVAWQKALWPHRRRLRSITLVGGNALVRMGGRLIGLALGVDVRTSDGMDADDSASASP
jgi:hypothetical protein